ncbi:MAG: molybdopterin molybdotransferase MoeA [Candidatus Hydrothermarchaeota archaeon]|nr:molybdopterin molybdotransferase MoeA [Candidatus Hydrothermarchaeota archaeon]
MDIRTKGFGERTPVKEALEIILPKAKITDTEKILFKQGLGRVLAEEVIAGSDVPPFDRAAMDGYAVKAENTFGASQGNPIYFRLAGEVSTGAGSNLEIFRKEDGIPKVGARQFGLANASASFLSELRDFEAVKIMTGAALPKGANAVVMFEYTNELEDEVEVFKAVTPGKNVSFKGEDVKKSEVLLRKGRIIRPQDIAMLAAAGRQELKVYRKPQTAIISTGDELAEPGTKLEAGEIYDANSYALAALVQASGGIAKRMAIIEDSPEKIRSAINIALENDVILISGATSVGKKDVVPQIVAELGEILVHGVAMRPGEPTGFGVINKKLVFMLPGYPVAAIVAFETFVRPALQKMQGMEIFNPYPQVQARLKRKIASELGRRDFARVKLEKKGEEYLAEPVRTTGSGIISSLVRADGFVIVPENTEGIEKGEKVMVNLF